MLSSNVSEPKCCEHSLGSFGNVARWTAFIQVFLSLGSLGKLCRVTLVFLFFLDVKLHPNAQQCGIFKRMRDRNVTFVYKSFFQGFKLRAAPTGSRETSSIPDVIAYFKDGGDLRSLGHESAIFQVNLQTNGCDLHNFITLYGFYDRF